MVKALDWDSGEVSSLPGAVTGLLGNLEEAI